MKKRLILSTVLFLITCFSCVLFCSAAANKTIVSNNGSTAYAVGTPYGLTSSVCNNAPFKKSGDSTVLISGTSTIDTSGSTVGYNFLNLNFAGKIGSVTTYKKIVVQFDVLLTQDGTGVGLRGKQEGDEKKSFFKLVAGEDIDVNTWTRVAFVLGADGNDNTYSLYLNGKEYSTGYTASGAYGFTTISWINTHCANGKYFEMYLDNVLVTAGDTGYVTNGASEITSVTGGLIQSNNAILAEKGTTYSQIRSAISTTSTSDTVSFYNQSGEQVSESNVFSENDIVTITNSEGIITAYIIKTKVSTLYMATGETVADFGGSLIDVDYGIVDAPLKSSADKAYSLTSKSSVNADTIIFPFDSLLPATGDGYATVSFDYCASAPGDYISIGSENFGTDVLFANRWYKISYVMKMSDKNMLESKTYLNGELYSSYTPDEPVAMDNLFVMTVGNNRNLESKMYLDNIGLFYGNEESVADTVCEIRYYSNELKVDNNTKIIYGVTIGNRALDLKNAILSETSALVFPIDKDGCLIGDDTVLTNGCGAVVLSSDGIYNYYRLGFYEQGDDRYVIKPASTILPSVVNAEFDCNRYSIAGTSADVILTFNSDFVNAEYVNKSNITVTSDSGQFDDFAITVIGSDEYASAVKLSFNNLKTAQKYIIHIANLSVSISPSYTNQNTMVSEQIVPFATAPGNGDNFYASLINNAQSPNAWKAYGGLPKMSIQFDADLGEYVIRASDRRGYYNGIMQNIPIEEMLKITGENYGSSADYNISVSVKSGNPIPANEPIVATMVWSYKDGSETKNMKLLTVKFNNMKAGEWNKFSINTRLTIPQELNGKKDACIYIHLEGTKTSTTFSDFYVTGFSIKKVFTGTTVDLTINENAVVNTVKEDLFGYCIEGGTSWWTDYAGEAMYRNTNQWKPEFLEFVKSLNLKTFRFGGYTANYEFWKTSLGDIEDRIPTYAPSPAWDTKPYWRDGIEYIATMERMQLAETSSPDASIIMCVNMWSYLKDIDYSKTYTTPITPSYVVTNNVIDYTALDIVTEDIIDYIRFCTLNPSDPKAVGSDGVNWAQKRVDLGHEKPFKVDIWELGNELYYRGITGDTYVSMCNYIIPKIRAIFPDAKIAAHIDASGASYRWREYVIENLASKIDYLAFHTYYKYSDVYNAANLIDKIESTVKASDNPNIKFILTEGGLNNFRNYIGPSNQSIIMPVSFADFMNRIAKKDVVESFEYFGSAKQICYDYTNSVKKGWRTTGATIDDEYGFVQISDRGSYLAGLWQDIPYSDFKQNGHKEGMAEDYKFDFSIKPHSDNESFKIEINWIYDTGIVGNIYSRTITPSDYISNQWNNFSELISSVSFPEEFDGQKYECLRIIITGVNGNSENGNIDIKDVSFKAVDFGKNLAVKFIFDTSNQNQRKPTALSEMIKYYKENSTGEILQTDISNNIISKYISAMAIKEDDGVLMFLANTDPNLDYTINLASVCGTSYTITESYGMYADDLYAERNTYKDDIYSDFIEYNSGELIEQIELPASSVLVVKLTDITKFVPSDIFCNNGITVKYNPQTSIVSVKSEDLNKTVNVYVASYRDNKLNDICKKQLKINSKYEEFDVSELDVADCKYIKIYVWSSNEKFIPYCNVTVLQKN